MAISSNDQQKLCECFYKETCISLYKLFEETITVFEKETGIIAQGKKINDKKVFKDLVQKYKAINVFIHTLIPHKKLCDNCDNFLFSLMILTEFDGGVPTLSLDELKKGLAN